MNRTLLVLAVASLALAGAPATTAGAQQASPAQKASAAPISIDWRVLAGLDYEKGTRTDTLKALDGKRIRMPGFIVPLDDADEEGAEFLLVPYYGACVHTPPPPPNQMAFV